MLTVDHVGFTNAKYIFNETEFGKIEYAFPSICINRKTQFYNISKYNTPKNLDFWRLTYLF